MAKYDPTKPVVQDVEAPPRFHFDVDAVLDTVFDPRPRSLWIGVGGDVEVVDEHDVALIYTVPDAYELIGQWKKVNSAGTTATQIRGWY